GDGQSLGQERQVGVEKVGEELQRRRGEAQKPPAEPGNENSGVQKPPAGSSRPAPEHTVAHEQAHVPQQRSAPPTPAVTE
ncbi:hypothetical protein, partial [Actinoplanes philippinensis]|uniref:hypothetical protein n=1 Tax=Actinoplanes philippinensis TaxID=35752 RepID=UPI0033FFF2E7